MCCAKFSLQSDHRVCIEEMGIGIFPQFVCAKSCFLSPRLALCSILHVRALSFLCLPSYDVSPRAGLSGHHVSSHWAGVGLKLRV